MNPLGNGNIGRGGMNPQLMQNIKQVKSLMNMSRGDINMALSKNPMYAQLMQMCKGQNPEVVFRNMAAQMGVNPDELIKELRS